MAADPFRAALYALSGSRASVQAAATFFAAHGAAPACTSVLCAHAAELAGPDCFAGRLRLLFVANEALTLGAAGVAPALLAGLPALLHCAACAAPDADALDKLSALVQLWGTRAMVPVEAVPALMLAAGGGQRGAAHEADPLLLAVGGGQRGAAHNADPPVPAGALPALVRRAGALGYAALPRAEAQLAAARGTADALPAATAQEYYELRCAAFYEAAARSAKRGRPDAEVLYELLQAPAHLAGRGGSTHVGIGGGSDASAADAFRRAKSEAYVATLQR